MKLNIPLMQEAEPEFTGGGGPSKAAGGLMEALGNTYKGDGSDIPVPAAEKTDLTPPPAEKKEGEEEEIIQQVEDQSEPTKPKPDEGTQEGDEGEEEEEFPEIGAATEKKDGEPDFDEKKFDEETEALSKGMKADVGRKFKELRQELKLSKQSPAAAPAALSAEDQQKLTEYDALKTEIDGLRQRNNELLQRRDIHDVMESEEYQSEVLEPAKNIENILREIAKDVEIDEQDLFDIILEKNPLKQDKAIDALVSTLGIRGSTRVAQFADDWKKIEQKKAEYLADASKTVAETRKGAEERQRQEETQRHARFKAATEESFTKYGSRIPGFTDSSGQLTDTGKSVLAKVSSIRPSELSEGDLGYMTLTTQAFPVLLKKLRSLESENSLLKAGKTPNGGKAPTTQKKTEETPETHLTLTERMAQESGQFTFSPGG